ncbi:MAG: 2-oxoglutarate dehydrogenase complex dihydrolipoyllysine-residue succinyltransferase [Rhodospirillales bacterium]|nr:2-oxoglutarate dehydrogenase complex dihydrolipoyllysine-residue succinyltransferase [Rhodospirillales bacterium]MCW8969984.1 2-oxoglutarate dehydrogenase complex dihydrolipoyllysine-residue succinyltransferase [Rhodospirillales bacterium]
MATEIKVPTLGESVTEATVTKWFKNVGDAIAVDEPLVELETDKVTVEVPAPTAGTLVGIVAAEGAEVAVGAVLGSIEAGAGAVAKPAAEKAAPAPAPAQAPASAPAPVQAPAPAPKAAPVAAPAPAVQEAAGLSPAVRRLVNEHGIDPTAVSGSGKDGRLTKGDVLAYLESKPAPAAASAAPAPAASAAAQPAGNQYPPRPAGPREERVRMTRLRKRIAERLKEAQNNAAMLTTFNEIDMTNVMAVRNAYKEGFEKKHGVKLGFMSFFTKACVVALREFPAINAEIDGEEIVYKNFYDVGVAVGTPQGLVVPVVRDADSLSFAELELAIADYGRRARDGKLGMEDMTGGTFTISNGGVYGSLLSTPILNPPQSGILGMHKTEMRPRVMPDGSIQARPMMYLALSYDHRIVDGREAVSFLVRVKECIEDPQRIMLDA